MTACTALHKGIHTVGKLSKHFARSPQRPLSAPNTGIGCTGGGRAQLSRAKVANGTEIAAVKKKVEPQKT
jgi:hypothetical protein